MGLNSKNWYHVIFQIAPNIFSPKKLSRNLRHPIYEWIHTKHEQIPLEKNPSIHVVKHYFFGKLVTYDLVKETNGSKGEYYGHGDYFPQTFNLIERIYLDGQESLKDRIRDIVTREQKSE